MRRGRKHLYIHADSRILTLNISISALPTLVPSLNLCFVNHLLQDVGVDDNNSVTYEGHFQGYTNSTSLYVTR